VNELDADRRQFLRTVAAVLKQRQADIFECLSLHSELRTSIRSIITAPPDNNIPTPPSDAQAPLSAAGRASLEANVADCVTGLDDYTAEETKKRKREHDIQEVSAQKTESQIARENAVDFISRAVDEIVPNGICQLQRRIVRWREMAHSTSQKKSHKIPTYMGATKKDVAGHIRDLKAHFEQLRSIAQWPTLVDRVEAVLIAAHYSRCNQANRGHSIIESSLYKFFARVWWEDSTGDLQITSDKLHKSNQSRWRDKLKQGRHWENFEKKYGIGFLAILPESVKHGQWVKAQHFILPRI
jgi:hypothetical protein